MSLETDEQQSSSHYASFSNISYLIPQQEGRSYVDEDGNLMEDEMPRDRSNMEFFRMRELGLVGPNMRTLEQRAQYACIPPNQTLYDLPIQFAFAKRFSPCGKVLD